MTGASKSLRWGLPVVLAVSAALAAGGPAGAAPPNGNPHTPTTATKPPQGRGGPQQTDQGVVQSVSANEVVLKALDGSSVTVPVDGGTRVLVDGKVGTLQAVKPGFVAVATWKAGKAAQALQAFDLSPKSGERLATVRSVSSTRVVVTGANGGTVTIHANVRTHVFLDGRPSALRSIDAGDTLVVTGATANHGKPAVELRFLSPS
jgi:UDP-N-acetylmuramyl tripeptide synthase